MVGGRSRGPAGFGHMGAGFGIFRPGCMLKVSHTLAARMCSLCFWWCGRCGDVVPLLCDLLVIRRFLSSSCRCCRSFLGAYFSRRGVFAILLVSYDLRCVASPPLEIVQCLRDWFLYWLVLLVSHYQFRSHKLVSFRLAVRPVHPVDFVVRVFGAECCFFRCCVIYRSVVDRLDLQLQILFVAIAKARWLLCWWAVLRLVFVLSGTGGSKRRYPCAWFNAGCNTKGYRALSLPTMTENILILLRRWQ